MTLSDSEGRTRLEQAGGELFPPADMVQTIKAAVNKGLYASNSEIVREALREWYMKQLTQERRLEALHQDISRGLDDIRQGWVKDFDASRIVAKVEKRLNFHE